MPFNETDQTDQEIIASYIEGNEEIFKKLIERYTSPLYNFTVHLVDKDNAPDIVQEIFIKVWKNLHAFDPHKASFKTWIFIVARNTTTDFLRKSGSLSGGKKSINFSDIKTNEEDDSFSENIPAEELLPDEALQKLQDAEFLNNLLDKLPENYKTTLILHYQEEMTFQEISQVFKKPLNTVKSWHRRAILSLRETLN